MVRDSEFLQMALEAARERLVKLDVLMEEADDVLIQAAMQDGLEVNVSRQIKKNNITTTSECLISLGGEHMSCACIRIFHEYEG